MVGGLKSGVVVVGGWLWEVKFGVVGGGGGDEGGGCVTWEDGLVGGACDVEPCWKDSCWMKQI